MITLKVTQLISNKLYHLRNKKKKLPLQGNGVLAQLVERLNGIQKVRSSILLCSTRKGQPIGCPFLVELVAPSYYLKINHNFVKYLYS